MATLDLGKFKQDLEFKEKLQQIKQKKKELLFDNPEPVVIPATIPFAMILVLPNPEAKCLVKIVDNRSGDTIDQMEWDRVEAGVCWFRLRVNELMEKGE